MTAATTIHFRIAKEDSEKLTEVCDARGESESTFIRTAVLKRLAEIGCFSEDRRKILLSSK